MFYFRWQRHRESTVLNNSVTTEKSESSRWTMKKLRKQKTLQKDIDIPVTVFMTHFRHSGIDFERQSLISADSTLSLRVVNTSPILEHILTLEKHIQQVISLTKQLIKKKVIIDIGSFELQQLCADESYNEWQQQESPRIKTFNRLPSIVVKNSESTQNFKTKKYFFCCHEHQQSDNQPLPSLRNAVDLMFVSLVQFLHSNSHFIRTELVSSQSIGDILAFHTLSHAFKDMVEATTNLAKNARRVKNIDTQTWVLKERTGKNL